MKQVELRPASRLAIEHRYPGANLLADEQVRNALRKAGYGALPLECRGDLYVALSLVLKDDPDQFSDLVDNLRSVLSAADYLDRQIEFDRLNSLHPGLKACPECLKKPESECAISSDGEIAVVCLNHPDYVIARTGDTTDEAIVNWNNDDWTSPKIRRELFPFG